MAKQSPASTWTKNLRKFPKKHRLQRSKYEEKKSKLGLEPLLVEIENFLDTTQKYETLGFKCQNAHQPPQPQEGQET